VTETDESEPRRRSGKAARSAEREEESA
jgi:hypothetical protein